MPGVCAFTPVSGAVRAAWWGAWRLAWLRVLGHPGWDVGTRDVGVRCDERLGEVPWVRRYSHVCVPESIMLDGVGISSLRHL